MNLRINFEAAKRIHQSNFEELSYTVIIQNISNQVAPGGIRMWDLSVQTFLLLGKPNW